MRSSFRRGPWRAKRGFALALLGGAALSCQLPVRAPEPAPPPTDPLWRAPDAAAEAHPDLLRLEPRLSVAPVGQAVALRLGGDRAGAATCSHALDAIASPPADDVVDVECRAGDALARAQVTFTSSLTRPLDDPYAGGVSLFKLARRGTPSVTPVARQRLGLRGLDAKLAALGAWVHPAFPFDRNGAPDRVGLAYWIAVQIPPGVNYYQAVAWLRDDRAIHRESWTPQDASWLEVEASGDWPEPLQRVTRTIEGPRRAQTRHVQYRRLDRRRALPAAVHLEAPALWTRTAGQGVTIAIVDSGVDTGHASLAASLIHKPSERPGVDADGNGVAGDGVGLNTTHLALARVSGGPPRLGLGLLHDVSDWATRDGVVVGHGTALASLAAASGGSGQRLGVAPRAWVLAVDVQENLRVAPGHLHAGDPRMRERGVEGDGALRSSVWARAAGVAYAASEGARVLTCDWSERRAWWLLHDALSYAEDNCALPICGDGLGDGVTPEGGDWPARWRQSWLDTQAGGEGRGQTGEVWDAWTGQTRDDFFLRALSGTLLVADSEERQPDLLAWSLTGGNPQPAARSNPRNDHGPAADQRTHDVSGTTAGVGIAAGVAALLSGSRPDLPPHALRDAIVDAANETGGRGLVPLAHRLAQRFPRGSCKEIVERRSLPQVAEPWYKQIKIGGSVADPRGGTLERGEPEAEVPPASRDR